MVFTLLPSSIPYKSSHDLLDFSNDDIRYEEKVCPIHRKLFSLKGKDPLAEVIKELFSVIKLAKIVKNKFSTTSIYGYRAFGGAFNGNSTQLKKMGDRRLLQMFFSSVCY